MTRLALAALVASWLMGCVPQRGARTFVSAAAHGVVAADEAAAEQYAERAAVALAESETLEEYAESMGRLDTVERALRVARGLLESAELALDGWRSGGDARFAEIAPCLAAAVLRLAEALADAGVPVPSAIADAVGAGADFVEGVCRG